MQALKRGPIKIWKVYLKRVNVYFYNISVSNKHNRDWRSFLFQHVSLKIICVTTLITCDAAKKRAPPPSPPNPKHSMFLFVSWSAAPRMTITFKMATETSTSATNQSKNVLIGVTGSVASIKLPKLVEELLLLPSKVLIISYRNRVKFIACQCQTILILQVKHAFFLFLYSQISKLSLQIAQPISLMRAKFVQKFSGIRMNGR